MAYENAKSVEVAQSEFESMMGQANSVLTMANDLYARLSGMNGRINGNPPLAGAQGAVPKAVHEGMSGKMRETLSDLHTVLTNCHSKMESLEKFV